MSEHLVCHYFGFLIMYGLYVAMCVMNAGTLLDSFSCINLRRIIN